MKKVICYKRVSTEDQADKGFSLLQQEASLLKYCEFNNYEVVAIFTEDYSGKTFNRPEWKKLMEFCYKNKGNVDLVLTNRWDRFSRNQHESLNVISELRKIGVSVNTVEQPLDLSISQHKLLLALYLSLPEVENDVRSITTFEGSRRARITGCWTGSAPRGYKNVRVDKKSTLEASQDAGLIIESFERMATGMYSANEVRRWLNSQGMKISKNQFYNLIRNPAYTGKILVSAYKDEPASIVVGLHPPLISDELFAAANEVLEGRKRKMKFKDDKSDIYPLKGLLRCEKHNLALSAGPSKGRYGVYHYYVCTVKNDRCNRYRIEDIHDLVEGELSKIQFSAGILKSYRVILSKLFQTESHERRVREGRLQKQLENLELKKRKLQNDYMNDKISVEEYREFKMNLDNEVFQINEELKDIREKISPIKEYLNNFVPMLDNLLEFYRGSNGKTKKRILSCIFLEKISFSENRDAAISYSTPISVLLNASKVLVGLKKEKEVKNDLLSIMAPPAGLEPATL